MTTQVKKDVVQEVLVAISCHEGINGMWPYLFKSCAHGNSQTHTCLLPEVKSVLV